MNCMIIHREKRQERTHDIRLMGYRIRNRRECSLRLGCGGCGKIIISEIDQVADPSTLRPNAQDLLLIQKEYAQSICVS